MASPDQHPCGAVIHRIDPWVFLGGSDAAEPSVLREHGISRVVRLYAGPPDVRAPGVEYFVYPALDVAEFDIRPVAVDAVLAMQAARADGAKILVNCHAGVSRSATAVLLYLMVQYRLPLDEALEGLRRIRPCVNPNPGFMACLRATDAKLRTKRRRGRSGPPPRG